MAIGERIGTMIVLEEERPAVISEPTGFVWRVEYTILLGVMALLTAFAIAFFYFSANIESLKSYGYAGLFLINIIGAASILLPSPAGGDGRGRGRAAGGRPGRAGVRLGGTGRGSWRGDRRVHWLRGGVRQPLYHPGEAGVRESMTGCRSAASSRCS